MIKETILGYPIAAERLSGCLDQITGWLDQRERRRFLACANPHSLMVARTDPAFQKALLGADLLTPDGVGILHASRILGGSLRERVTGSDIFHGLSRRLNGAGSKRYSYFFLGSSSDTLRDLAARLRQDFPRIHLAGLYSPPFKAEFTAADNSRMLEAVNSAKPDVLWVGMTAPKQEKWIHRHLQELEVGVAGAVGAVFDFYTGRVVRSAPVFQDLGLEWLPRLLREPRRLWRRNLVSSPAFLIQVLNHRMKGGRAAVA